jgi:hypothetical protein
MVSSFIKSWSCQAEKFPLKNPSCENGEFAKWVKMSVSVKNIYVNQNA